MAGRGNPDLGYVPVRALAQGLLHQPVAPYLQERPPWHSLLFQPTITPLPVAWPRCLNHCYSHASYWSPEPPRGSHGLGGQLRPLLPQHGELNRFTVNVREIPSRIKSNRQKP